MNKKKVNKKSIVDFNKTIFFIEELHWLLESRKEFDLKIVIKTLRDMQSQQDSISGIVGAYKSPNPNKHFLIGALPKLFQDSRLFPTNESIASFATEILMIKIPRFEKRSKYELIGKIVCETDTLSDHKLSQLVNALSLLTVNEDNLNKIREERKDVNFSWNETIQKLTGARYDSRD